MLQIQKKLTPYNYSKMTSRTIQYIVIHYVGKVSTAKNNADYFHDNDLRGTDREASAHYFVDEKSIWQSVEDKDRAWHCGGGLQGSNGHTHYGKCTNYNSIGVEMCVKKDKKGVWYIEPETINNTVDLVKMLIAKHNIPVSQVIRHYDVTGKTCPEPMVRDEKQWFDFLSRLSAPQKLETGNDIIWELMNGKHKIEITEVDRAVKALDKAKKNNEYCSLYWILYKLVNGNK